MVAHKCVTNILGNTYARVKYRRLRGTNATGQTFLRLKVVEDPSPRHELNAL